jgi:hypothetical protein
MSLRPGPTRWSTTHIALLHTTTKADVYRHLQACRTGWYMSDQVVYPRLRRAVRRVAGRRAVRTLAGAAPARLTLARIRRLLLPRLLIAGRFKLAAAGRGGAIRPAAALGAGGLLCVLGVRTIPLRLCPRACAASSSARTPAGALRMRSPVKTVALLAHTASRAVELLITASPYKLENIRITEPRGRRHPRELQPRRGPSS